MSVNKQEPTTKTISLRMTAALVDEIKANAKSKGINVQEYFLSQILPSSELGQLIATEQIRLLTESKNIKSARNQMAEDARRIQESFGLSEEQFINAATQALRSLINKSE